MRAATRLIAALLLAAAPLGAAGGCLSISAYERGETIPAAEAEARSDDLGALIEEKLAQGDAARAFHGLELARTRRTAADMIVKREERRAPAPWVTHLADRMYAGADLSRLFGREEEEALASSRALPAARAGPQAAAQARDAAARDDERFWEDLRVIEARMHAYQSEARRPGTTYASLFADRVVIASALDARLTLSPGEALVEYHLGKGRADAFVVTSEGMTHVPLPATGEEVARGVAALRRGIVDVMDAFFRRQQEAVEVALASGADPRAALERVGSPPVSEWLAPSRALHALIFAPVEAALARAATRVESLLIVAPGALANCPFAALLSGEGPGSLLVERYRIAYEPSFSIYKSILSREMPAAPPRLLAVGNTSLALAPREARVMGRIFEGSAAWIGPREMGEARFKREVKGYNILHLATHGRLVEDAPRLSHLALAPGEGEDGLLTAVEVATQLDLSHTYVAVLSACQTALSAPGSAAADAEVSSIASAFLLAGAPSVVGSLWEVSDESTTRLMVRFYEGFLEVGTAEALRRAQRELLKDEKHLFRHPYFWAAFGVYGYDK